MKEFTQEEARAMRGTEFIYEWKDGDSIPAFIAEVDLTVGLTCKALSQFSTRGYKIWEYEDVETSPDTYDNIICINLYIGTGNHTLSVIQKSLNEIADTGKRKGYTDYLAGPSELSCAF